MNPLAAVLRFFHPPAPAPRRPAGEVAELYPSFRWQMLRATFLGYATYYLVRNNYAPIKLELEASLDYTKTMLGNIGAATALSYGVGKFLMGVLSDRSDARKFMATGLALSALCNFAFGASTDYYTHLWLWSLNGWRKAWAGRRAGGRWATGSASRSAG